MKRLSLSTIYYSEKANMLYSVLCVLSLIWDATLCACVQFVKCKLSKILLCERLLVSLSVSGVFFVGQVFLFSVNLRQQSVAFVWSYSQQGNLAWRRVESCNFTLAECGCRLCVCQFVFMVKLIKSYANYIYVIVESMSVS